MKIEAIRWATITVEYSRAIPRSHAAKKRKRDVFENSYVYYDSGVNSLKIVDPRSDRSILLAKAKLVMLTPCQAKWEAAYWSAKPRSTKFDVLIPATITCTF